MVERKGIITAESVEESGEVNSWPLPSLNRKGKIVRSAKREGEERAKESIENVAPAARPRHLTASDIDKITRSAEEEGFKAGYEEGFAKGEIQGEKKGKIEGEAKAYKECKAQLDDEYARLYAICEHLLAPMLEHDQAMENMLMDMALHFANELLQKEIDQNPESFRALIAKVIKALPAGSKNISIFLHPDDAALMEKVLKEKNQHWPIQTDDSLLRGGCRVETRESIVDYSVEKRWKDMLAHPDAVLEEERREQKSLQQQEPLEPEDAGNKKEE